MDNRRQSIKKGFRGTCDWLFQHENFKMWQRLRSILCIRGHPGTGKSTLMDFAYSSLRDQPLHSGTATAAFFFYGQVAMQKTTLSLFRSILYQLLEQIPSLRTEFLSRFKSHQEIRSSL